MEHFSFRDLKVWQISKSLAVDIAKALINCRDFGFLNQISRSSLSVPSNIAEGFERKGQAEFVHYLYIAKGSCAEVITQLEAGKELTYFTENRQLIFLSRPNEFAECSWLSLRKKPKIPGVLENSYFIVLSGNPVL